jgi:hypothetical protein
MHEKITYIFKSQQELEKFKSSDRPTIEDFSASGRTLEEINSEFEEVQEILEPSEEFGFTYTRYFFSTLITLFIFWLLSSEERRPYVSHFFYDIFYNTTEQHIAAYTLFIILVIIFSFLTLYILQWVKPKKIIHNEEQNIKQEKYKLRKEELILEYENQNRYLEALTKWDFFHLTNNEGFWMLLKGIDLENEVQKLLELREWIVSTTPIKGDMGIDLICNKTGIEGTVYVQCKGHKKHVGVGTIRDANGVQFRQHELSNRSGTKSKRKIVVVAPRGFSKGAIGEANLTGIELITSKELVEIVNMKRDLV